MVKILRIIFAIVIITVVSYGLITDTLGILLPYALFLIGLMLTVMGVVEFQKRKPIAFTTFLAAGFCLFLWIYSF